ncbi:MAG: hypothetical protein L0196_03390 [candidate division Zixibacteria bacterium]|nr:hypothetical protein [candidate division Zixibacteria bacterium]
MYTPTGKLGKVVWEKKEFQIQTEFLHRPRPHIVTTVFVGGEVVHKVDFPWVGGLETDEDKRALDRQLVLQHRETTEHLEAKVRKKAETKRIFEIEDLQRLAADSNAAGYLTANPDGVLQMEDELSEELKEAAFLFSELVVLLSFLEKNTKLGRFRKGEGTSGHSRLFLGQAPELFVGLAVRQAAKTDSLKEEFEKLLPLGI